MSSKMIARRALMSVAGVAVAALLAGGAAVANTFPDRPITLVVPFGPGGGVDTFGRILAQGLSETLGVPVVVENRPGAGTRTGTDHVRNSPPDGYTLALVSNSMVINATVGEAERYNPLDVFSPVSFLAVNPMTIVVASTSGIGTMDEFVAAARARPGALSYASAGIFTASDLLARQIMAAADISMEQIPYQSGAAAVVSVINGETDMFLSVIPGVTGRIETGELTPLAITTAGGSAMLPDVPTMQAEGFDIDYGAWYGLVGPSGMDAAVIDTLLAAIRAALDEGSATREQLEAIGNDVLATAPDEFSARMSAEIDFLSTLE